ncbi:uroporphyrinogen-III synthase /uroporphyrinogen-III C-methyltransferase [Anaerobacterium chartisolvens]|uniref:uroporphyrinogen-III C-methyltransferase n=1 Tax=Anaerobacterium chartisolvens TaxID=1297424 RepID=A0A369B7R5_9FIRM|nr:uroporphyrinogen-III C-methyltransferase [Anaerobacterium chartisolvens]RCX17569.1 uroporphyrinogen-III synthase /uroporphyrinogen-III C-methyltransferase [Anaerobacterium chartisolvens]
MSEGRVYIIGAGPGDWKLMTLRAAECIGMADVIVYDRLVDDKAISMARPEAEFVYVGKMPHCHTVPQEEINRILVSRALEGKKVARVKGGDPFVFGRGGEEAEALLKEGIDFEIIPGVTSAVSVPAYAGIPVTHRDYSSSLHIITGHERADGQGRKINYELLAELEGTLVFLMGVKSLPDITASLIKHGKDASTPAAVIENGTTVRQRTVCGTLGDICRAASEAGIQSPAVVVVGRVVELKDRLAWFGRGPLAGKRVLVTRSRQQAGVLSRRIEELGGEAIELPAIAVAEAGQMQAVDAALERLEEYRWLVFTSTNGVGFFLGRMREKKIDIRKLSGIGLCAVGEATAAELAKNGLNADYIPRAYTTEELASGLAGMVKPGERVLLARSDIAGEGLCEILADNGIQYDDVAVYRTILADEANSRAMELLESGGIDYITFTSSSTVRGFVGMAGTEKIGKARVVCIGPVTAETAREKGIDVWAVADRYTIDGLVDVLLGGL